MYRIAILLGVLSLAGCSLSGVIESSSKDYNVTIEYVTNNMLVENILRARDQTPLHFTDLSLIHGSLQLQASAQASVPFGNLDTANTRTRNIAQPAISISSSPSFDIAPLNTSKFSSALYQPVELSYFQEYLREGVPQALLMRLMIERIDFVHAPDKQHPLVICSFENTPSGVLMLLQGGASGDASAPPGPCPPPAFPPAPLPTKPHLMPADGPRGMWDFDALVWAWRLPLIVHSYERLTPYGPPLSFSRPSAAGDLARSSASGMTLKPVPGHPGEYQFYKQSSAMAFCIPEIDRWLSDEPWRPSGRVGDNASPQYTPGDVAGAADTPEAACWQPTAIAGPASDTAAPAHAQRSWHIYVQMRSILGMFRVLGRSLQQQDAPEGPRDPSALNFYIKPSLSPDARFNVLYQGQYYHVDPDTPFDNTLRILSILNQLLNTLKNASEIPSTQSVEALP